MRAGFRSVGVSPTPLRGTGFQPVHPSHGQSCPCFCRRGRRRYGLGKTVQATLCLGETPQPRVACVGETPTLRGTTS
ncbi:MAG: hypothetical protein NZ843_05640 [Fimbriimonadales bacterium]|nr:hypothetical protein [Fimbriimonadales bacterium]